MCRQGSMILSVILGLSLFMACKKRAFSEDAGVSQTGSSSAPAPVDLLGDPTESTRSGLEKVSDRIIAERFADFVGVEAVRYIRNQGFQIDSPAANAIQIPEGNGPITVRWNFAPWQGPARTVTLERTIPRSHPFLAAALQDSSILSRWKAIYVVQALVADLGEALQNDMAINGELTGAKVIPERIAAATVPEAVAVRELAREAAERSWREQWSLGAESEAALRDMSPQLRRFLVTEFSPEGVRSRVSIDRLVTSKNLSKLMLDELDSYRNSLRNASCNPADILRLERVMAELARRVAKK